MNEPNERALAGQAALVTGGGSGIGLACARHLVRDGASVVLFGRSEERLRAGAATLAADLDLDPGDAAHRVQLRAGDVAVEDDVAAAAAAADGLVDGLRMVVAAAGNGMLAPIVSHGLDVWESVLATNLTGAMLTFKHGAAAIARRRQTGAMVGISSIAGPLTHRFMSAYCVSKAGLEALVRNAADELGPLDIRVNAVRPGLVPTELADPLVADEVVKDDYLRQMPLGRLGTVDDVAAGVRYLLGPESGWVTGQILAIDGGHTLRRGPDVEHWARALYGDDVIEGRT